MEKTKITKSTANCIDFEEARAMILNYERENGHLPSYTKSVWFGLDELEQIIRDIRTEQYRAGEKRKRYGIRFYFGKYNNNVNHTTISGDTKDYSNRNTILMVSTRQQETDGERQLVNENYYGVCLTPIENKGELCPDQCLGDDLP